MPAPQIKSHYGPTLFSAIPLGCFPWAKFDSDQNLA